VHAADGREVHHRLAVAFEDAGVGVVRQQRVNGLVERRRLRSRHRAGEVADQPAVAAAGLEHVARAERAAVLDVYDHRHVAHQICVRCKCFRAEEAGLLAVCDQEDDRVAEPLVAHVAGHVEQRRRPHRVVGNTRAGAHGVVVRGEQHLVGTLARQLRDDVLDRGAGDPRVAHERALRRGLVAELSEANHDPLAKDGVRRRAGRMRRPLPHQLPELAHGPLILGRRTVRPPDGDGQNSQERKGDRGQSAHQSGDSLATLLRPGRNDSS
jgi:hypothetical protein